MFKILIASDRIESRNRLKQVCKDYDLRVCGEAENLEQALIFSELYLPDIVIFNFRCAIRSQTLVISQVAQLGKSVKILIYSSQEPTRSTHAYVRAGASGFLVERSDTEELVSILRGMIAGFTMVPIKALKQPRVKLAHRPASTYVELKSSEASPP